LLPISKFSFSSPPFHAPDTSPPVGCESSFFHRPLLSSPDSFSPFKLSHPFPGEDTLGGRSSHPLHFFFFSFPPHVDFPFSSQRLLPFFPRPMAVGFLSPFHPTTGGRLYFAVAVAPLRTNVPPFLSPPVGCTFAPFSCPSFFCYGFSPLRASGSCLRLEVWAHWTSFCFLFGG